MQGRAPTPHSALCDVVILDQTLFTTACWTETVCLLSSRALLCRLTGGLELHFWAVLAASVS